VNPCTTAEPASSIRFAGRVAIVTGGGGSLGRNHALLLASRGAAIVVNDLGTGLDGAGSSDAAAQAVAAEIVDGGGRAIANGDDVADPQGAERLIGLALDAFGRVDIVINNAGILRDRSFVKMDLADFRAVLDVHLMGAVHVTKAAWRVMRAQNYGRIVLTTSHVGLHGNFGQANYAAAKMALVGLMDAIKLEGERYGILVNAIAPLAASRMAAAKDMHRLKALLDPALVSAAVAYLSSEACKTTGIVLAAGGGYFGRAEVVESSGVRCEAGRHVTPEDVAIWWNVITDLQSARPYHDATERLTELFPQLKANEDEAV